MQLTTVIVSGPKRSGTTLLNRLFDSQPGIIDFNDEGFFWEHVYRYDLVGHGELFLDLFRSFTPARLTEGFIDRDILPWIEGRYSQRAVAVEFDVPLAFNTAVFKGSLGPLAACESIEEVWETLVAAYVAGSARMYKGCGSCLIKTGDYGMSIMAGRKHLKNARFIFIMRNPFFALDSLKKSREIRKEKVLNPFNFGEAVRDYAFLWDNWANIAREDTVLVLYEDLLRKPREVMGRVAEHLGIPFTDNLLEPTLQGELWPGLSSFAETKGIDASILDRPLKVLAGHEVAYVRRHLKGLLDHFGYTPESQVPTKEFHA